MRVVEADTQRSSQKQKSNANQRQSISSELIEAGKVIVNQSGSRPSITDSHGKNSPIFYIFFIIINF